LGRAAAVRALALAAMVGMPTSLRADGKAAPSPGGSDRAQLIIAGGRVIDATFEDLSGKKVELSSLRGHPVLLDFFATWCEPCRIGLPRTDALVAKNAARGLVGWAISLDETAQPVAPFAAKLGLKLPVRWDRGARVADDLGIELLPALILLDATGAVRYRAAADDPAAERHLEEAVEDLLAQRKK